MFTRIFFLGFSIILLGHSGCGNSTGIPTADVYGTITINGEPVEGITVSFVPEAKMRPSIGFTDANGYYEAQFVKSQSGVTLGPCVVEFAVYRGQSEKNWLPKEYHEEAAENPEFQLDVTSGGLEFNYDIKYDGDEIPPYSPPR